MIININNITESGLYVLNLIISKEEKRKKNKCLSKKPKFKFYKYKRFIYFRKISKNFGEKKPPIERNYLIEAFILWLIQDIRPLRPKKSKARNANKLNPRIKVKCK